MDTSELYIKMCERAVEMQNERPFIKEHSKGYEFDTGDYFVAFDGEDTEVEVLGTTIYSPSWYEQAPDLIDVAHVGYDEGAGYSGDKIIWLPRQDQLQEMLGESFGRLMKICYDYYESEMIMDNSVTFEQFWLKEVMKEKFNKKWNGEDWEVIKSD